MGIFGLSEEDKSVNEDIKMENFDNLYVPDIDEKTNLPIRPLPYQDTPKFKTDLSWLKNGRHVDFTFGNDMNGYLFLNSNDNNAKGENTKSGGSIKLYPFESIPDVDHSAEYINFIRQVFDKFSPLLANNLYKCFRNDDTQLGVISLIKDNKSMSKLREIMTFFLSYIDELIKQKSLDDPFIINYANCLNVLNLLYAVLFSDDDESIPAFQQWIQFADVQPEEGLLEAAIGEEDKPYKNHQFWSVYVKKLLTHGMFSLLLSDLASSQYEETRDSDPELFQLIKNFTALISSYDPVSFSRDLSLFVQWKTVSVNLRESAAYLVVNNQPIATEIYELLGILSGLPQTIMENCDSWYECFVSQFLYEMPSKDKIAGYLKKSYSDENFEPMDINTWDYICIDVLQGNYLKVLSALETSDKSIATFMAIILEASGVLNKYVQDIPSSDIAEKINTEKTISDSIDAMVNDLATTYLGYNDFFDIGVGILMKIKTPNKQEILAQLLPTYKIKNTEDFEWVISICMSFKLSDTLESIFKIQGQFLFEMGYLYEAIHCFAEAGSPEHVLNLSWKIFEMMLVDGDLKDSILIKKMINNEIQNPMLRNALAPLMSLYEILRDDVADIDILWFKRCINLLNFRYMPTFYKPALFLFVYLSLEKLDISTDDLLDIIVSLDKYENQLVGDFQLHEKCDLLYELLISRTDKRANNSRLNWADAEIPITCDSLVQKTRKLIALELGDRFLKD